MAYDTQTIAAIHEALDDEYRAHAVYAAVIAAFGPVRPFIHIIDSEVRHARALQGLLLRAGLPIPPDRWLGQVEAPETLQEAYAQGVQAEIDNHALYQRLNAMTGEEEVLAVFAALGHASQHCHLPAFQRHVDGAGTAQGGDAQAASSTASLHGTPGGCGCGGHGAQGEQGAQGGQGVHLSHAHGDRHRGPAIAEGACCGGSHGERCGPERGQGHGSGAQGRGRRGHQHGKAMGPSCCGPVG